MMMKTGRASRVSSLFFCDPHFSMFFDYIFFGGKLTITSILGAILTLISVRVFYLITNSKNINMKQKSAERIT